MRKNGYYFVKREIWGEVCWIIAEYRDAYWYVTGTDNIFVSSEFIEIIEERIELPTHR